jgi:hypothetical protein
MANLKHESRRTSARMMEECSNRIYVYVQQNLEETHSAIAMI